MTLSKNETYILAGAAIALFLVYNGKKSKVSSSNDVLAASSADLFTSGTYDWASYERLWQDQQGSAVVNGYSGGTGPTYAFGGVFW